MIPALPTLAATLLALATTHAAVSGADDAAKARPETLPSTGGEAALAPVTDGAAPQEMRLTFATSKGDIVVELDRERSPLTVAHFLRHVRNGLYDGTVFHRVVPGFVAQAGAFKEDMATLQGDGPLKDESGNGLRNLRGTLAMARTRAANSASTQFFFNLKDNPSLDADGGLGCTVFGRVVAGTDVLEKIGSVPTAAKASGQGGDGVILPDCPREPLLVRTVRTGNVSAKAAPLADGESLRRDNNPGP